MLDQIIGLQKIQIELLQKKHLELTNSVDPDQDILGEVQKKIDDLESLYDKNEESIKQHEDWLLPRARYGDDDPETFINNIYERRMESQSSEAKARSILERDQLLRVLKENQEIESEN